MNAEVVERVTEESVERLPEPPPGMTRVTKTELVWPGKYTEDGTRKEVPRVSLPFQVIERINESRATREAKKVRQPTLFDVWEGKEGETFEEGWRNKLIWGENLLVIGSLLEKFAGKIDLIYIDPPFATGADFSFTTEIGDGDAEVTKDQSIIEEKAYRDTWGRGLDSYLSVMFDRFVVMRDLLAEKGSLYVHLDWHVVHYAKAILDEVFGLDRFVNEVVWRRTNARRTEGQWPRVHDVLLLYVKGDSATFSPVMTKGDPNKLPHTLVTGKDGRKYQSYELTGAGLTKVGESGRPWRGFDPSKMGRHWGNSQRTMDDWDKAGLIHWPSDGGFPRRRAADPFDEENRMVTVGDVWADIDRINQAAKERLNFPTQKPEALLERIINSSSSEGDLVADFFCGAGTTLSVAEKLGRRWIGCDLSRWAIHLTRKRMLEIDDCRPVEILNLGKYERQYWQGVTFGEKGQGITEQAVFEYYTFVLRLYGAQPVAGLAHLQGKKGRAVVHIGAVDAPVTIDEINLAIDECAKLKQPELHVLGWEWEMGLYDLMVAEAKRRGVKLLLLQIPREVMEQQAVDWDFQQDTFMQGWVTYRTRMDRTLALKSDPHTYDKPGHYRILVKVIDIFGNDTSQAFEVEVR